VTLWIVRGLLVGWAIFSAVSFDAPEQAEFGKMARVLPAIAVLVVVETVSTYMKQRRALRDALGTLGFQKKGGEYVGMVRGRELSITVDGRNEFGKGLVLETTWRNSGRPLGIGHRHARRAIAKATGQKTPLDGPRLPKFDFAHGLRGRPHQQRRRRFAPFGVRIIHTFIGRRPMNSHPSGCE